MRSPAGPTRISPQKPSGRSPPGAERWLTRTASSGSGLAAPTPHMRGTSRRLGRSANITASSWSIRWCCAARRSRRPSGIPARPIATSFIRRRAGSSAACAWSPTKTETIMAKAAQTARGAGLTAINGAFAADVLEGLTAKPKRVSPKYFYDLAGSALFERITHLPEYYPTRSELGLLKANAPAIGSLFPPNCALVEFGAGSSRKARILLGAATTVEAYVPVDISGDFVELDAAQLRRDFPRLIVLPLVGDFAQQLQFPAAIEKLPRVGFFPGSTIGNFDP